MSQFPDIISFPCDCSKNKTWTCNRPTWNLSVSPPEMWDWVQTPQAAPTSLGLAAVSSTAPHLSHTQSRHGFPCFSSHCHPLSACWAFVFANIFSWGVQTLSPHSVPCISHISFLFLDLASRSWAPGNHPDSPSRTLLPTAFSTEILSSMGSDICFPFYYFFPLHLVMRKKWRGIWPCPQSGCLGLRCSWHPSITHSSSSAWPGATLVRSEGKPEHPWTHPPCFPARMRTF